MVRLTRSTVGYLFFYEEEAEEFRLFAWSREVRRQCRMENPPTVYRLGETGLWGEAVRQRRPVITNDYAPAGPLARGLPPGHVALTRHMNAPIIVADRIVAVAGVGNKEAPYQPSDERQMTLLVRGVWEIVMRKQREEEILLYQRQLHTLMDKLSRLEDQERKRIADELHDTVGQNLAIAKLKLSLLREGGGEAARGEFDEIAGLIDRTIQFSRSLTGELSPPLLYEFGLEAAAKWLAEQTQAKHGLPVGVLPCGALPPLAREMRVLLYKVLRELLFNVVKHANATQASVRLAVEGETFHLEVSDDGVGFDRGAPRRDPVSLSGFGLFSIRERLRSWNGVLEIGAAEGGGSRVCVRVPVIRAGQGAA
jgi:signal transduction histidine kinase